MEWGLHETNIFLPFLALCFVFPWTSHLFHLSCLHLSIIDSHSGFQARCLLEMVYTHAEVARQHACYGASPPAQLGGPPLEFRQLGHETIQTKHFTRSRSFLLLKKLKEFLLPQNSSTLPQHTSVFTDTPLKQLYEFSNEVGGWKSFYLSFQNVLTILTQNFQIPLAVADSKNIKKNPLWGKGELHFPQLKSLFLCFCVRLITRILWNSESQTILEMFSSTHKLFIAMLCMEQRMKEGYVS